MKSSKHIMKQPPTAFVLFCKDMRPSLVEKCPNMSPPDVSALLSQLWKSLQPPVKLFYRQQAMKFKIAFGQNINSTLNHTIDNNHNNNVAKAEKNQENENISPCLSDSNIQDKTKNTNNKEREIKQRSGKYYPLLNPNELFYQVILPGNKIQCHLNESY